MKLEIELGGKPHTIECASVGGRLQFSLDGKHLDADARELAPGTYSVLIGGQAFEVRLEPSPHSSGASVRVAIAGREYTARVRDPRKWRQDHGAASEAQGKQQVTAPMPGKIIRVLVKPGNQVEAKQGLIVVEAMKMQNEIRSPKTGTVERLMVKEGQAVNAGQVLAVIA